MKEPEWFYSFARRPTAHGQDAITLCLVYYTTATSALLQIRSSTWFEKPLPKHFKIEHMVLLSKASKLPCEKLLVHLYTPLRVRQCVVKVLQRMVHHRLE